MIGEFSSSSYKKCGVPDDIINGIKNIYKETHYKIGGEIFQSFRGLKQGFLISPLLFAIYISGLEKALEKIQLGGIVINKRKIFSLAYADDIVLLADRAEDLKDMMEAVPRFSS